MAVAFFFAACSCNFTFCRMEAEVVAGFGSAVAFCRGGGFGSCFQVSALAAAALAALPQQLTQAAAAWVAQAAAQASQTTQALGGWGRRTGESSLGAAAPAFLARHSWHAPKEAIEARHCWVHLRRHHWERRRWQRRLLLHCLRWPQCGASLRRSTQ